MPEIITRGEAKALGLKRYFSGNVCPSGHLDQRYVDGGKCVACSRIHTARYRKKHPGKVKTALEKWREENRDYDLAKARQRARIYREKNPYKAREWRGKNAERIRFLKRASYQRNREKEIQKRALKRAQQPQEWRKYYYEGPSNPKGEIQWLRKNKTQLRNVRRLMRNRFRDHSQSQNAASSTDTNSPS